MSEQGIARIELAEYSKVRRPMPPPTTGDLALADRLSAEDGRLKVLWLSGGDVEISSTSWVGVVRFSAFDAVVVPKLVGGSLNVLRMLEYVASVDMLRRLPEVRPLPADGAHLLDLICLLLAEETKALVRTGILRNYHVAEEQLPVLRGSLRVREQFTRQYGQLRVLECRYDEYDADIPDNQLIALALGRARQIARTSRVKDEVGRMYALMAEVCEPQSSELDWYKRSIRYGRNNGRYRPAHELAKLVLRATGFSDLFATSSGNVNVFLVNMNTVFEMFVTRLAMDALKGSHLTAESQSALSAVINDDEKNRSYSTISPDLVIRDTQSGRSTPIDIKYKTYGDRKVSTSDIYQAFLYAYALGSNESDPRAGLIYPAQKSTSGPRLSVRSLPPARALGARVVGAGLDVQDALQGLHGEHRQEVLGNMRGIVETLVGACGD